MLKKLRKELLELESKYRRSLKKLEKFQIKDFKGTLVISKRKQDVSYYLNVKDDKSGRYNRKYLNKSQKDLIKYLAQKSYNDKIRKFLEERLSILSEFNSNFEELDLDFIYNNLSQERKELVTPVSKTWEQALSDWNEIPYNGLQKKWNMVVL